jgi:hypothetical protein
MGTARAAEAWFRRCGCRNRETGSLLGAQLEVLSGPAPAGARGLTTGEWLASWVSLRASTSRGYAAHVRGYLVPYLGGIPLAELSPADVQQYPARVRRPQERGWLVLVLPVAPHRQRLPAPQHVGCDVRPGRRRGVGSAMRAACSCRWLASAVPVQARGLSFTVRRHWTVRDPAGSHSDT